MSNPSTLRTLPPPTRAEWFAALPAPCRWTLYALMAPPCVVVVAMCIVLLASCIPLMVAWVPIALRWPMPDEDSSPAPALPPEAPHA